MSLFEPRIYYKNVLMTLTLAKQEKTVLCAKIDSV